MHLGQARQLRGFERQRPRAFVERCRHREHHPLLRQWRRRVLRIPRRPHMGKVTGRGHQRRDFGHAPFTFGRAPGQDGRAAVHARVRQPALGAGHAAPRHQGAQVARIAPHQRGRIVGGPQGGPGLRQRIGRQLAHRCLVTHRWQQRLGLDLARRRALGDGQQRDGRAAIQRRMGDHGVAGAEVDADDMACIAGIGGRSRGSHAAAGSGKRFTLRRVLHPWPRRRPAHPTSPSTAHCPPRARR